MNEIKISRFNQEDFIIIAELHLNSFKFSSFSKIIFGSVKDSNFKEHLISNSLNLYEKDNTNTKIGLKAIRNDKILGYCLMEERNSQGVGNIVSPLANKNYPDGFDFEFASNLMEQEPTILEHHYRLRILAVDPTAQSLGVGTALMQYCIDLADEKRLSIYLAASEEATSFYLRHDFVTYGKPCIHKSITTTIMIRLSRPLAPLIISPATSNDSIRFAQIHRAAFSPFTFHKTIYGNCSPKDLDITFENRFKNIISNPLNIILKATRDEFILGFAFYELPIPLGTPPSIPIERTHPKGINLEIALPWFKEVDEHARSVKVPHYHLHIIGTEPSFQKTGVAKTLIEWSFKKADEEGINIHLDATSEGIKVYEKLGFVRTGDKPIVAGDGIFDVTPMVRFPVKV